MRRLTALMLFTVGYAAMALLSPAVAALPALAVFSVAGLVLLRRPAGPDEAERIARGLARKR